MGTCNCCGYADELSTKTSPNQKRPRKPLVLADSSDDSTGKAA